LDDRDLLDRLRRGDQAAFDAIFRAYYAQLVFAAREMLRSEAAAEDIVQDIMLVLWRRRESLVVEDSLKGYLYRSTRNRALNALRHEKVKDRSEPGVVASMPPPPSAGRAVEETEIDAAVQAAVNELPERCREVFVLSRVHNLRYSEIASTMGISVKTVEAQMGKALRLLRERLKPWLEQEG
jgi:RNA polymerase sigma-70 factor, ECF subfamily